MFSCFFSVRHAQTRHIVFVMLVCLFYYGCPVICALGEGGGGEGKLDSSIRDTTEELLEKNGFAQGLKVIMPTST